MDARESTGQVLRFGLWDIVEATPARLGEQGAWQALHDAIERLRAFGYSKRAIACELVLEKSLD